MTDIRLALDATVRSVDADGRLHVRIANISKANVCGYLGAEIPGYQDLGLDPARMYQLLRDPDELANAAATFNNLPLLTTHVPVTADDPQPHLVVGSTGTDAEWSAPFLTNSLVVWDAGAIAGIESGDQKELSCAYRYVPVMEPGVFGGIPFDGRMTRIVGNHVALVEVGRAGADVVVGDSKPKEQTSMAKKPEARATKAVKMALDAVAAGKLAADASVEDIKMLLDNLDSDDATVMDETLDADGNPIPPAVDEDPDAETPEEKIERLAKRAAAKPAKDADVPSPVDAPAMDAAIKGAVATLKKQMNEAREAERFVRPWVGDLHIAADSAEGVYRAALDTLGVRTKELHPTALRPVLEAQPKPGAVRPRVAADSAASASEFNKLFPGAARVKHV